MNELEILTNDELDQIDTLIRSKGIRLEEAASVPLKQAEEPLGSVSALVLEQQGRVVLSDETRRMEELRLAKLAQKKNSLRHRKQYTRKPGRVHPKKKQATAARKRRKQWAEQPLTCVLYRNRYKCKRIEQESWSRLINPLWVKYDPSKLDVVFPSSAGTRADPWTVYNMKVVHKELGVVYDGEAQLLWELSS